MFFKKTDIVLGEKNFGALMLAINFLKQIFDPYASPTYSTIKCKSNKYNVTIGFESERINASPFVKTMMAHYEMEVVFSISEDKPYRAEGLVQIFALHGLWLEGSINFYYKDEKYIVPEETEKIITEYYDRIKGYLPPGNKYPISKGE